MPKCQNITKKIQYFSPISPQVVIQVENCLEFCLEVKICDKWLQGDKYVSELF
jgi:hypothetical protein